MRDGRLTWIFNTKHTVCSQSPIQRANCNRKYKWSIFCNLQLGLWINRARPAGQTLHRSLRYNWLVCCSESAGCVYLLAPMFKGNVTLPSVDLSQKWVSGGINIHYTENEEESGNIPSVSTHQWSCRALRACTRLKCVFWCINTQTQTCTMQAVSVERKIHGRGFVALCVCGRGVDSSELKE